MSTDNSRTRLNEFRCPTCGYRNVEIEVFALVRLGPDNFNLVEDCYKYFDDSKCRCISCNRSGAAVEFKRSAGLVDLANLGDAKSRV